MFLFYARVVNANFEITEIMYDASGTDTGREWIEVKNTGNAGTDLSKWYLFSDNTKHSLTPQGESNVPVGSYAIITQDVSKFKIDWPNFSGLIFDSSWTGLNNDGETIGLKDPGLNLTSSVTYTSSMGASGDGNSLQKIGSSFISATPTTGMANSSDASSGATGGNTVQNTSSGGISSGSGGSTQVVVKKKEVEISKITTDILVKNTVVAGLIFPVGANTIGLNKESLTRGRFLWNFGDGVTREDNEYKSFNYSYQYPGEYLITLSYYQNYYNAIPDATDRLIVRVVPQEVFISSVGNDVDPYVEIENKTALELDLSQWTIKGLTHNFIIPNGTILLPGKKLKFSPKVTFLNYEDLNYLTLLNPSGEISSTYPVFKISVPIVKSFTQRNTPAVSLARQTGSSKIAEVSTTDSSVVDLNNITASVANAKTTTGATTKDRNLSLVYASFIGVIIIGSSATILMHRKNTHSDSLEGRISADDIKIIE